jgi:hypothetical protein
MARSSLRATGKEGTDESLTTTNGIAIAKGISAAGDTTKTGTEDAPVLPTESALEIGREIGAFSRGVFGFGKLQRTASIPPYRHSSGSFITTTSLGCVKAECLPP